MKFAFNYLRHDFKQGFINEKKLLNYVTVYILFIVIFALALKQSSLIVSEHIAISIWLTLLTNIIIISTTLFQDSEQQKLFKRLFLVRNRSFTSLIFYQCFSYCLQFWFTLVVLLPLIKLLIPELIVLKYLVAFSLSVPSLTIFALLCSALSNSSTNKGGLLSLLFLPLSLPITLFSISLTQLDLPFTALLYALEFKVLFALFLLAIFLGPLALSKIIKQSFLYN